MLYFNYEKENIMKKENTAIRLKTIMNMRGLRQVDILNLTVPYCQKYNVKMNKSDISQYCSGKTEPPTRQPSESRAAHTSRQQQR